MCLKPIVAAVAAILLVANFAVAQDALKRLESTLRSKPAPAEATVEAAQPYLGFVPNETIEDGKGVHVDAVSKGGPAELGGLKPGDLITAIDGKPVRNLTDFDAIYGSAKVGQKLNVTVERAAKVQKLTITLAARPAAATVPASDEPGEAPAANPALVDPAAAAPTLKPPTTAPPLTLTDPAAPAASPPLDPLAAPADSLRAPRSAPIRSKPAAEAPLELGTPPADPSAAPAGLDPLASPEATPLPADGLPAPAASRPSLGIKVVELTDQARATYNLSVRRGALITYIRPGSPADTAGLPVGGVVVALDGKRIDTADQLVSAIGARTVGTEIELTYYQGPDLARKSLRLAPAPTALVADAGATPPGITPAPLDLKLGGSDRPLLNKVEQLVEGITSPRTAPGAISRGPSTVYDPSEMAALRTQVLELEEKVTALEERVKLLESKLGATPPAANPAP